MTAYSSTHRSVVLLTGKGEISRVTVLDRYQQISEVEAQVGKG